MRGQPSRVHIGPKLWDTTCGQYGIPLEGWECSMEEMTGKTRHIQSEATQGKVVSENPGSKCLGLLHLGLVLDGRHADQPFFPERVSLWRFASWKSADLQTRGLLVRTRSGPGPTYPGEQSCVCATTNLCTITLTLISPVTLVFSNWSPSTQSPVFVFFKSKDTSLNAPPLSFSSISPKSPFPIGNTTFRPQQ